MCCLNKQAKTEQAAVIFGLMRTKAHVHFITEPNQTKAASAVKKQLFAWEGSRDKEWRSRSQHMLSQTREKNSLRPLSAQNLPDRSGTWFVLWYTLLVLTVEVHCQQAVGDVTD